MVEPPVHGGESLVHVAPQVVEALVHVVHALGEIFGHGFTVGDDTWEVKCIGPDTKVSWESLAADALAVVSAPSDGRCGRSPDVAGRARFSAA